MKPITVKGVAIFSDYPENVVLEVETYGEGSGAGKWETKKSARKSLSQKMQTYFRPRLVDCTITITPKGKK